MAGAGAEEGRCGGDLDGGALAARQEYALGVQPGTGLQPWLRRQPEGGYLLQGLRVVWTDGGREA